MTRSPHRRGLTLAELVVTMGVASVVMVGAMSAMIIASHALPGRESPAGRATRVCDTAAQIADELGYAVYFTQRATDLVAFTVPDRDADGRPERIRYAWAADPSGIGPLTRKYNDQDAIEVLTDVSEFSLGYELGAAGEVYGGAGVLSSENVLVYDDTIVSYNDTKIETTKWRGQYFRPTVPSNAYSWRPTWVGLRLMADSPQTESTYVQLRPGVAANNQSTTVLQEIVLPETSLSTWDYNWVWFDFSGVRGISPGDGLSLILKHPGSGGASCKLYYDDADGTGLLYTDSSEPGWTYYGNRTLRYYVYGRVSTPGPNQNLIRQYVTGVRLRMRTDDQSSSRVVTTVPTINTPEVLSRLWELDFNRSPTAVDVNGDGHGDWVVRGGGSFDAASLSGGIWYANCTLDTYPDCDFTQPTTVDLRFRNTSLGGKGAVFWINLDRSGSQFGVVYASLMLQTDGTQMLIIYTKSDNSTIVPLRTITGLPSSFVNLRLLLDPGPNTVSIQVNGEHKGTYNYLIFSYTNNDRFATIMPWGSNAEFDYVRIRVGGTGS